MKKALLIMAAVLMTMTQCKKDDDKSDGGGTQTVATVTTGEVTEITETNAVCGGEVESENGWAVTARGVCWSTESNPTPSDNHTVNGEGVGAFTSEMTGLEPGTKYYVRAYAKNAAGTSFGAERSFTTQDGTVATVTTGDVTDITQTTAVCGGEVESENGWAVTARGVCWSTEPNPTPSDNHTVNGEGVGAFTSEMTGLEPGTKYYVRAYAKNAAGTGFGAEKSFTTQDHEYVDLGLPSGLLWATCNVGADSPEDNGWYFMWGSTTNGGDPYCSWDNCPGNGGSSSYNSSAIATWDASNLTDNVLNSDVDAAHANWGGAWRMPTIEEWQELYDNTDCAWTTENGVNGRKFTSKTDGSKYIFFPAAGYRGGTGVISAGSYGGYWSSSLYSSDSRYAYGVYFYSGNVTPQGSNGRYCGSSVRPVH